MPGLACNGQCSPGPNRQRARILAGMRRVFIAVAILVALAGCGADDTPEPSGAGRSDETRGEDPALQPMPRDAEQLCSSIALVRAACPRPVPEASAFSAREIERPGLGYTTFNLEAGTSYADPSRDRPPSFVHLVVEGGKVRPSLDVLVYSHRRPVKSRDGLLDGPESREAIAKNPPNALYLGDRTWGGKRGELVLAPPYDKVVSIHGGHLIFVWSGGKSDYVVSLHAWEPFTESESTLKAIVESIP